MAQNIPDISVLITGATLTGLGAAAVLGDAALIVERASLAGAEFSDSLNPGDGWNRTPLSSPGQQLRDELVHRNILSDEGQVHIPALAPVLFNLIRCEGIRCLFVTDLIEILSVPEGFRVTVHNGSGFQSFQTQQILDTTAVRITCPEGAGEGMLSRQLRAMLHPVTDGIPLPALPPDSPVGVLAGRFPSEVILTLALTGDDDWVSARDRLHRYWQRRDNTLRDWRLASVASTFAVRTVQGPRPVTDRWNWLPSAGYGNPLEAYEAGRQFAGEVME